MSAHTYVTQTDIGNAVFCDCCNTEYTSRDDLGGMLFESKAYCPTCMSTRLPKIKALGEERFIREFCPPDMKYREWVLGLRGGNNTITVTERCAPDERDGLDLWVIYENPSDYPGRFVLRKTTVEKGKMFICQNCTTYDTLEAARAAVPGNLANIGRMEQDDPCIVEVWV